MQPPQALTQALELYDRGLRVRWSSPVGQFCIERRHGYAGLGTDAVLRMLHDKWKRLEDSGTRDELLAYDEYRSRAEGYQPILYLHSSETAHPEAIVYLLMSMDIRRAGGPEAWAQQHKDAQEMAAKVVRMQRRARLRALAEESYDRVSHKKDFYGSGGDAFFYQHDRMA